VAREFSFPLVSRQGIAAVKLAGVLATQQPGDRLQPVREYAQKFGAGVGTMHGALAYLERSGAVKLDRRGHLGTFIREINYPLLWRLSGQNYILGGMPLPYSRRLEGLATGLHEAFEQAGMALNLVYSRGALNRLQALSMEKLDFVVLSRFACRNARQRGMAIEEVLSLGVGAYVGQHIILLADHDREGIEAGMRVGIDTASIDQVLLAKEACLGKDVKYVEISYMNLMEAMEKGQIDATIWNGDDFYASYRPFKALPLVPSNATDHSQEDTEAVIVVGQGNLLVLPTLRSIINKEFVCEIQRQVMDNERMPTY
jgi:hypothetical protein